MACLFVRSFFVFLQPSRRAAAVEVVAASCTGLVQCVCTVRTVQQLQAAHSTLHSHSRKWAITDCTVVAGTTVQYNL